MRRCGVECIEGAGARWPIARQHTDIGARDDRGQSGNPTRRDPRLDNPEFGARSQHRLCFASHLRRRDHMRAVGSQCEPSHPAEFYMLVADCRALGFQPIGCGKA